MQDNIDPASASQAVTGKNYTVSPFLSFSQENRPIRLIFFSDELPAVPRGELPRLGVDWLGPFFRAELDDLSPQTSLLGFPASIVALAGYKWSAKGRTTKFFTIPRGGIVVPSRNAVGRVSGLWNPIAEEWITVPQPHCCNLIRRNFTREIEIHPSIVAADVAAIQRNVAAICLNGVDVRQISQRITGENPEIVNAQERRAA